MADALMTSIRFLLFADLMLILGLAAFPLYALRGPHSAKACAAADIAAVQPWLCGIGLIVSLVGMFALTASMHGIDIVAVTPRMLLSMATETDVGKAWIVRMLALGLAIIASRQLGKRGAGADIILSLAAATALTTLVWSGHAAASDNLAGAIHRAADALHMIAAAIWIGAIAAFLILLRPATDDVEQPRFPMAAQSLERFAQVGTICVLAITATGLINFKFIVGLKHVGNMLGSTYGHLLIAKLLLFGGMLALAALNRWRLTPALAAADGEPSRAAIRSSIALEAVAAASILALAAILGVLEP